MKKILVISFLLALSVSMMAQHSGTTTGMAGAAQKDLTLTSADTVTQHATAYWIFNVNRPKTNYFAVAVAIDTITSTPCGKTTWDVLGSMDATNWVATGATQVRPGGTTAGLVQDTTFVLYDVSTGVLWKYLKVQCVSSSTLHIKGIRVKALSLKVADK